MPTGSDGTLINQVFLQVLDGLRSALWQQSLSCHQVFQFYGRFGLDQDCVWSRGPAKALMMPVTCQSVLGKDSMKIALSFAPNALAAAWSQLSFR